MSNGKKESGLRGRIDRFFDKQAKEQQNLIRGKVGGTSIKDSWDEVKNKVGGKKKSSAKPKAHKVKESKDSFSKPKAKEVEISPLARSFIRVTTDYPPITPHETFRPPPKGGKKKKRKTRRQKKKRGKKTRRSK